MTEPSIPAGTQSEAVAQLASLVELFREEVGSAPSLGEFLEIVSVSVPQRADFMENVTVPLNLTATLKGNRRYFVDRKTRVPELNDAVIVEASRLLEIIGQKIYSASERTVTVEDLINGLLEVIKNSDISLEYFPASEVRKIVVSIPKKRPTVRVGDVVAIPQSGDRYRIAIVVARNRFGTAFAIFRARTEFPRMVGKLHNEPWGRPVYTEAYSQAIL